MEKISVIKTTTGETKDKKPWKRHEVELENGKKYATFDEKIVEGFGSGDMVELELVQEGRYMNLKAMKKVGFEPANAKNGASRDYHLSIEEVRARALESAIAESKNHNIMLDTEKLFSMAKKFEEYIKG